MNKTKIEWADYTWNPVTGCLHGCPYCYARRNVERFGMKFATRLGDPGMEGACKYDSSEGTDTMLELEKPYIDPNGVKQPYPMAFLPTFHRYKLDEPARKTAGVTIFVGSMCDLFGEWVPDAWIAEVFAACKRAPQHTYLFLTKNPARYIALAASETGLPQASNMWYGSTATTQDVPTFYSDWHRTFVSIEPILSPFDYPGGGLPRTEWIIMGAMTGPGAKAHAPKAEWIANICKAAEQNGTAVFMKDSLTDIVGKGAMLRQLPEGITLHKKEAEA